MSNWRVYGGQPTSRIVSSRRQARRIKRLYARLGIQCSLYESQGDDWVRREQYDSAGRLVEER